MDNATLIINRILPILLLIGLGYWMRRSDFVPERTIDDLRKLVVNLALPSVLFISFLEIDFRPEYLVFFVLTFGLCVGLLALGGLLRERLGVPHTYFPFLFTGFEYGMLGVSLFGGAYGLERFRYLAIIDLGHEIFIWFVLLSFLLMRRDGLRQPGQLVRVFLTSPVIIGILAGIGLNLLGARDFIAGGAVTGGVYGTLQFLSNLTVPLILVIVGYGIKFDRHGLREAAQVVALRLGLLIPLALLLNAVLVRGLLGLEPGFEAALFTLLILPPPFIIPLYMKPGIPEERRFVNNVLTLYTVVSVAVFAVYFALNPVI